MQTPSNPTRTLLAAAALACCASLALAAETAGPSAGQSAGQSADPSPTASAAGLASASADAAVPATPCSDFDTYVNGSWFASAQLPPDRARIGSFDTLRRTNDRVLEDALSELTRDPSQQSSRGLALLARYVTSGMDENAVESRGLSAVKPLLHRISHLGRADLPQLIGALARVGVDAPLSLDVGIDAKDATVMYWPSTRRVSACPTATTTSATTPIRVACWRPTASMLRRCWQQPAHPPTQAPSTRCSTSRSNSPPLR